MAEPSLELDRSPTPAEEADEFSSPNDRADVRNKSHELDVLAKQQGPIGGLIGCSDSALTIAFVLLGLGFLGIIGAGVGAAWRPDVFGVIVERLITFELTVAGYVMGKKSE